MNRPWCRDVMAVVLLGLVQLACDRSNLSKSGDAAVADAGAKDLAVADQAQSAAGADLQPDQAPADGPGSADVTTGNDSARSDLAPARDDKPFEVPSSTPDGLETGDAGADVGRADAIAGDAAKADAFPGDLSDGWASDGQVESIPPCGPGGGGCNDDPLVSSIWGTCQPDGTCACNPGFVINPSTGRCRIPPADASSVGDAGEAACSGEYTACGCGCCGDPLNVACYYPSLGETTAAIKAEDDAARSSTNCNTAGCSAGIRYLCCVPATPDPTSSASYTSDSYIGDLDHLSISKSGSDCAQISLSSPAANKVNFRIDTPPSWGVMWATFGSCGDASAADPAGGALGTVVLRASDTQCLVDVHVSLFAIASTGDVKTTRLDVDGLVVGGFPSELCK